MKYIELTNEEFKEKMDGYTSRLDMLFSEGKALEQSIKDKLGELKING
jgi:type I restriction enzyme M protein